jgi:hypothetical protein
MENKIKDKLYQIVKWLDRNYNQDSENYDIFFGAKPSVIRFDDDTAVSLWPCGAVVCIGSILYFIEEDDGHWFLCEAKEDDNYEHCGFQTHFSIGWGESFCKAITDLMAYVKENGEPVYFSGTDKICHYALKKK